MTNREQAEAMLARIAEYMKGWDDSRLEAGFAEKDALDLAELLTPALQHANGESPLPIDIDWRAKAER